MKIFLLRSILRCMQSKQYKDILAVYPGHDATIALIRDGILVEAMSEERLSRVKKHMGFPKQSLDYVKEKYGINPKVTYLAGDIPLSCFMASPRPEDRNIEVPRRWANRVALMLFPPTRALLKLRDRVAYRTVLASREQYEAFLRKRLPGSEFAFINHHLAHAWASVPFMPRDGKKRLVLTLDGAGDELCGSINVFDGSTMDVKHTFPMTDSLGLLYCAFVDLLGMKRNEHEFKVMGLAPYAKASAGEKVYQELKEMFHFDPETMQIKTAFDMNFATPELIRRDFNTRYRFDSMAYGIQKLTEKITQEMVSAAVTRYGISDVALGGGVFMNVKANQYIAALPEVTSVVVTPSCGDESLAIGAAVYGYVQENDGDASGLGVIEGLYLGSEYSDDEIKTAIHTYPVVGQWEVRYIDSSEGTSIEHEIARLLAVNSVVGRFKGRSEWGARALGNRSILANPTSRDNVKLINEMIKGRDFWMPFATSMLYERRNDYLHNPSDLYAPHMAITFDTKPRAHTELIAALHPYDLTSRPQMVKKEVNPDYHSLISAFEHLTGIGGILNTSFNLHGEPNVETPYDALRTFDLSGLPHLAIGNYLVSKKVLAEDLE